MKNELAMETLFYIYKQKLNVISCAVNKKNISQEDLATTLARARNNVYYRATRKTTKEVSVKLLDVSS